MNPRPLSRTALLRMTLTRFLAGFILIGCMLFIPAGTLRFWEAWLYIGLLFVPLTIVGVVLFIKDPELLERRMRMREREATQKKVIAASSLVLLAVYLIPGFDRRYAWSTVPPTLVFLADLLILLGYLLFVLTIRENRYASRVVEVQDNQVAISTGPYAFVRHPMYLAISVIFTLTPLALGSYWALIPALMLPVVLVARIKDEEQLLRRSLTGYEEYCQKVKYRLLPFIW
jgi:protein-S-isoprenylcysteine O-methyltransferase Ste14